jgi:hypothetical protein
MFFPVIPTVSKLFAMFVPYNMAEIHFRSMGASQKKVTSPTDSATATLYMLSVEVFFVIPTVSKLFAMFVSYIMAEIHFRSMGVSQNKTDVTIQFLVGSLVIHFCGIFCLSCSVQKFFKNFMLVQWLKNFSLFGGKYDP